MERQAAIALRNGQLASQFEYARRSGILFALGIWVSPSMSLPPPETYALSRVEH